MELEDQFGIKISDEDAQKIKTVGQAVDYVSRTSSGTAGERGGARAADRRAAAGAREHVFTHSSWAPDRASSYERLEFLGDSVLELAIARALYDRYPGRSEGRLAKIRSHVVSRRAAPVVARELGLGEQPASSGRRRPGGRARAALAQPERPRRAARGGARGALPRARLRARSSRRSSRRSPRGSSTRARATSTTRPSSRRRSRAPGAQVSYAVLEVEGPPHDRRFTCAAVVDGEQVGRRHAGPTKKAAEQEAAAQALGARRRSADGRLACRERRRIGARRRSRGVALIAAEPSAGGRRPSAATRG